MTVWPQFIAPLCNARNQAQFFSRQLALSFAEITDTPPAEADRVAAPLPRNWAIGNFVASNLFKTVV
jgi:hypothetical protein